ncbi:MAG: PhzF family phenazine biosynthesis protein [Thermoanaerobaculia bacterium]
MGCPLFVVDAFTDRPFAGNPAAVCVLAGERSDAWLANVARELNLSETAFLRPLGNAWSLRWFTPSVEVDLCGHATLGSAHALWEAGLADPHRPLRFETKSGPLGAVRRAGRIELDFPSEPPLAAEVPARIYEALGVSSALWSGRNRLDYLLELESEGALRALDPDFRALTEASLPGRGVIVTARPESKGHDFVSRYFAPAAGIDEDPVTGSAHCCLGPYWAARLDKTELSGYQASARGGTVGVRVGEGGRVTLIGQAVTVTRGELLQQAASS